MLVAERFMVLQVPRKLGHDSWRLCNGPAILSGPRRCSRHGRRGSQLCPARSGRARPSAS
eukprot:2784833-Pyramimonas_sp.AAC.1